ncbi:MAG: putative lipoprotein [Frankiales bacterium]|nr:putative lipoprotein [Frankiales bacterium]
MSGAVPALAVAVVAAVVAALVAVLVALLAACGSPKAAGPNGTNGPAGDALLQLPAPTQVVVQTRIVPGLGTVLTDSTGHTLYMFSPDARSRVSCTGSCAGTWPPLAVAKGSTPTAGSGVEASQLGTLADPNSGADITTYARYPLYRYAGDVSAGTANGQHLFLNGGPWYAMSPDGTPVVAAE